MALASGLGPGFEEVAPEVVIWFVKWKPNAESSRVRLVVDAVLRPWIRIWIPVVTVIGRWNVTYWVVPAGTVKA